MSLYKGTQLISGVTTPITPTKCIGQIIASLLPLTDAGLHLLDGAVIDGNGIYKSFVDYIKTIALTYSTCFVTEADWQTQVTRYGVCGKFVYDATANTVRLPKVTGFVEGTIDANALGDLIEAGLPNITGTTRTTWSGGRYGNASGAFENYTHSSGGSSAGDGNNGSTIGATFDASRSNSIYGNSDTVQPQSIKGYYYIVIATSTRTEVEVNINNITADLNDKASIYDMYDAGSYIASCAMPSSKYVSLTLGASDATYIAPANGWYTLKSSGTAGSAGVRFINLTNGLCSGWTTGSNGTAHAHAFIPALKGQEVRVGYSDLGTLDWFRFVYAEGEVE